MERKTFSSYSPFTLCVRAFSDSVLVYYNTTSPICQMQEFYTNKWYCVFSRAKCRTWAKKTVQFKSARMIQKKHNSVFFDQLSKWMKETGHISQQSLSKGVCGMRVPWVTFLHLRVSIISRYLEIVDWLSPLVGGLLQIVSPKVAMGIFHVFHVDINFHCPSEKIK